jgi:site-specific recombinase XerD
VILDAGGSAWRASFTEGAGTGGNPGSALKELERLRAFFRFVHESGWINAIPTKHIKNPRVSTLPTMPFSQDEMIAILAACAKAPTITETPELGAELGDRSGGARRVEGYIKGTRETGGR